MQSPLDNNITLMSFHVSGHLYTKLFPRKVKHNTSTAAQYIHSALRRMLRKCSSFKQNAVVLCTQFIKLWVLFISVWQLGNCLQQWGGNPPCNKSSRIWNILYISHLLSKTSISTVFRFHPRLSNMSMLIRNKFLFLSRFLTKSDQVSCKSSFTSRIGCHSLLKWRVV